MTKKRSLLVVEDDLAIRDAITRVLQTEDYHVAGAASTREALVRFKENHIDVVLLDITLGEDNGWEVFHALKAQRPELPIIVTSARAENLAHSSATRASAVLEKPFDMPTLLAALEETDRKPAVSSRQRPRRFSLLLFFLLVAFQAIAQNVAVSPARLTSLQFQNGNVVLKWQGGGPTNQVQFAVNPNGPWQNLGAPTTASGATNPLAYKRAFYRLVSVGSVTADAVVPGQLQSAKALLGSGTTKESLGVAADHLGNYVVVGDFQGTVDLGNGQLSSSGGYDAFIAKYNQQGALLWTKRIGSVADDSARAVAVDSQNNIIVVGSFTTNVDFGGITLASVPDPFGRMWSDIFVAKYNSSGVLLWAKRFGGTAPDTGDAVAIDASDNIFVVSRLNSMNADFGGFNLSTAGNIDVALTKLNSSGAVLWAKRFGGADGDWAHGLAVDRSGDVIVSGEFWSTTDLGGGSRTSSGASDIFVAKYSGADGSYRWGRTFGAGGVDRGYGVTVDPRSGNVIVTGGFGGSVDFGGGAVSGGIFLAGYDSSGNHLWSQGYGSSSTVDSGLAVSMDGNGNLAFGGAAYAGAVDFGGGWLIGNGNADLFVASFTVSGNTAPVYRWARRAGTGMNGVSQANAIGLDSLGHVTIAGTFQLTVDFGGITATGPGASTAAFAAQYNH